jgi:hypothetical protein
MARRSLLDDGLQAIGRRVGDGVEDPIDQLALAAFGVVVEAVTYPGGWLSSAVTPAEAYVIDTSRGGASRFRAFSVERGVGPSK